MGEGRGWGEKEEKGWGEKGEGRGEGEERRGEERRGEERRGEERRGEREERRGEERGGEERGGEERRGEERRGEERRGERRGEERRGEERERERRGEERRGEGRRGEERRGEERRGEGRRGEERRGEERRGEERRGEERRGGGEGRQKNEQEGELETMACEDTTYFLVKRSLASSRSDPHSVKLCCPALPTEQREKGKLAAHSNLIAGGSRGIAMATAALPDGGHIWWHGSRASAHFPKTRNHTPKTPEA